MGIDIKALRVVGLAAALLAAPTGVLATDQEAVAADPIYVRGGLAGAGVVLGVKVGGGFSQVFSDLGAAFIPELELGYTLPFADRGLQLFLTGQWAAPMTDGETAAADARLPGDGSMTWDVTQQEPILSLGLLYRVPVGGELVRPFVAAGGRVFLLRTEVRGSGGGEAYGNNEETGTEWGFLGALGVDLFVGPGALDIELQVSYSALDGYVMRNTTTGSLNAMVGYRFFL